ECFRRRVRLQPRPVRPPGGAPSGPPGVAGPSRRAGPGPGLRAVRRRDRSPAGLHRRLRGRSAPARERGPLHPGPGDLRREDHGMEPGRRCFRQVRV
ncbi:MAG: YCII-related protein, partial [uncultured Arthrobacter sp.]